MGLYPTVKKSDDIVLVSTEFTNVTDTHIDTDRQTDTQTPHDGIGRVGQHSRPHTVRVLTAPLLPAVMDQIFVDNCDFYTSDALLPSLEKMGRRCCTQF